LVEADAYSDDAETIFAHLKRKENINDQTVKLLKKGFDIATWIKKKLNLNCQTRYWPLVALYIVHIKKSQETVSFVFSLKMLGL
jgi:hypothetical protein